MVNHVPQRGIELVHRLAARPMQRLARVVLLVARHGDFAHGGDGVGKVHDYAIKYGKSLAGFVLVGEPELSYSIHTICVQRTCRINAVPYTIVVLTRAKASIAPLTSDGRGAPDVIRTTMAVNVDIGVPTPTAYYNFRIYHFLQTLHNVISHKVLPAVSTSPAAQEKYWFRPQ